MRKAILIVLALLAIRLLPRALRREARAAELLTVLLELTLAAATSKGMSTEARTAALETATRQAAKTLASQRGTTTAFSNLSQTQTGSPQAGGASYQTSSAVSGGATIQTGNPNGATISGTTVAAHTHGYGHIHDIAHFHFSQVAGDYNALVAQLNTMRGALISAGIL